MELIKSSIEFDEDVMISGFGKFPIKQKAECKGRNQATGEVLILISTKVVTFKCFGKLKEGINKR